MTADQADQFCIEDATAMDDNQTEPDEAEQGQIPPQAVPRERMSGAAALVVDDESLTVIGVDVGKRFGKNPSLLSAKCIGRKCHTHACMIPSGHGGQPRPEERLDCVGVIAGMQGLAKAWIGEETGHPGENPQVNVRRPLGNQQHDEVRDRFAIGRLGLT